MRDLRLAHAAGDEAAYRCILYRRPDGKSPAEVAAECVACDAALPAWAVWRDEQHRLQYEADERAVDAAEERNVWRFTRSDAMLNVARRPSDPARPRSAVRTVPTR